MSTCPPRGRSAPCPPLRRSRLALPPSQVLESLQQRLQEQLQLQGGGVPLSSLCGADHLAHVASRGSGPRIFCGHVPPVSSRGAVELARGATQPSP